MIRTKNENSPKSSNKSELIDEQINLVKNKQLKTENSEVVSDEEADLPDDFFDDFSNIEFMEGLNVIDTWESDYNDIDKPKSSSLTFETIDKVIKEGCAEPVKKECADTKKCEQNNKSNSKLKTPIKYRKRSRSQSSNRNYKNIKRNIRQYKSPDYSSTEKYPLKGRAKFDPPLRVYKLSPPDTKVSSRHPKSIKNISLRPRVSPKHTKHAHTRSRSRSQGKARREHDSLRGKEKYRSRTRESSHISDFSISPELSIAPPRNGYLRRTLNKFSISPRYSRQCSTDIEMICWSPRHPTHSMYHNQGTNASYMPDIPGVNPPNPVMAWNPYNPYEQTVHWNQHPASFQYQPNVMQPMPTAAQVVLPHFDETHYNTQANQMHNARRNIQTIEENPTSVPTIVTNSNHLVVNKVEIVRDVKKLFAEKKISLSEFLTVSAKSLVMTRCEEALARLDELDAKSKKILPPRFFYNQSLGSDFTHVLKSVSKFTSPMRRTPIIRLRFTTMENRLRGKTPRIQMLMSALRIVQIANEDNGFNDETTSSVLIKQNTAMIKTKSLSNEKSASSEEIQTSSLGNAAGSNRTIKPAEGHRANISKSEQAHSCECMFITPEYSQQEDNNRASRKSNNSLMASQTFENIMLHKSAQISLNECLHVKYCDIKCSDIKNKIYSDASVQVDADELTGQCLWLGNKSFESDKNKSEMKLRSEQLNDVSWQRRQRGRRRGSGIRYKGKAIMNKGNNQTKNKMMHNPKNTSKDHIANQKFNNTNSNSTNNITFNLENIKQINIIGEDMKVIPDEIEMNINRPKQEIGSMKSSNWINPFPLNAYARKTEIGGGDKSLTDIDKTNFNFSNVRLLDKNITSVAAKKETITNSISNLNVNTNFINPVVQVQYRPMGKKARRTARRLALAKSQQTASQQK